MEGRTLGLDPLCSKLPPDREPVEQQLQREVFFVLCLFSVYWDGEETCKTRILHLSSPVEKK